MYGSTDEALFNVFLAELDMIRSSSALPWCVGGEFQRSHVFGGE